METGSGAYATGSGAYATKIRSLCYQDQELMLPDQELMLPFVFLEGPSTLLILLVWSNFKAPACLGISLEIGLGRATKTLVNYYYREMD